MNSNEVADRRYWIIETAAIARRYCSIHDLRGNACEFCSSFVRELDILFEAKNATIARIGTELNEHKNAHKVREAKLSSARAWAKRWKAYARKWALMLGPKLIARIDTLENASKEKKA